MTVLSSSTETLLGSGTGRLPRVNLLPPEIAEAKKVRKVQAGLGAVGVGAVVVVGLLYVSAGHSVTSAQAELDAAQQQKTQLQSQISSYGNVTATIAAATAAQQQLVTAMGDEVRYSQLLDDLSLTVPSNVWFKSVAFASTTGAPAAGTAATAANQVPQVGTLTVTGVGFSHDDVAAWLDAVAGLKTYANPYFSNSTEALIGTRKTVNFSSTAVVTPKAQSGRYSKPAGS